MHAGAGAVLQPPLPSVVLRDNADQTGGAGRGGCCARALRRGALDGLLVEDARAGLTDLLLDLVRDARLLQQHVNSLRDVLVDVLVVVGDACPSFASIYELDRRSPASKG